MEETRVEESGPGGIPGNAGPEPGFRLQEEAPGVFCPDCREEVDARAEVCRGCGRRLREGRTCPACHEEVHRLARKCKHCGERLPVRTEPGTPPRWDALLPLEVSASPFGSLLCGGGPTALLFPPRLLLNQEQVVVSTWALLGLRKYEQRLPLERIASVRYDDGVIWGGLVLETFGGVLGQLVIPAFLKSEGRYLAGIIEQMMKERS